MEAYRKGPDEKMGEGREQKKERLTRKLVETRVFQSEDIRRSAVLPAVVPEMFYGKSIVFDGVIVVCMKEVILFWLEIVMSRIL